MQLTREQVDELEKLIGQLGALHVEMSALVKKSTTDAVNDFKLGLINSVILRCNELFGKEFQPFEGFDQFQRDALPSTSDVTLVLSGYMQAAEKFRSDHIRQTSVGGVYGWFYETLDGEPVRAAPPAKLAH
jgi:hypothetical protein